MSARAIRRAAARRRARGLTAGAAAGAALAFAPGAQAADFTVTTTASAGPGSLREAIDDANVDPDADRILFAPSVTGTITVAGQGPLFIDYGLEIVGPGSSVLTVSGGDATRIFDTSAPPGAQITLSGLRIANGYDDGTQYGGGAILHNSPASLTISRSVLESNEAGDGGGALALDLNVGRTTIEETTISGNTAELGGGIASYGGTLRIIDSTISGNNAEIGGGGIAGLYSASVKIQNSTISGNRVSPSGNPGVGGGIVLSFPKYTQIESSTVTDNSGGAGGGGGISVVNYGGGDASTPVVLHNSIVAGNTAATDADLSGFAYGGSTPDPVFNTSYSLIGSTQGADVRTTVAGSNVLNRAPRSCRLQATAV